MSGLGSKGRAYIIFDYLEALRIYDAVGTERTRVKRDHCTACAARADSYDEVLLSLVEFFNTVALQPAYTEARTAAKEAHDASTYEQPAPRPASSE